MPASSLSKHILDGRRLACLEVGVHICWPDTLGSGHIYMPSAGMLGSGGTLYVG